jgi:hypothetical protein
MSKNRGSSQARKLRRATKNRIKGYQTHTSENGIKTITVVEKEPRIIQEWLETIGRFITVFRAKSGHNRKRKKFRKKYSKPYYSLS